MTHTTPPRQVVKRIAFADGSERAVVDRDRWLRDFGFRAGHAEVPRAWSPVDQGNQLLVAGDGVVRLFDPRTGNRVATMVPSPRGAVVLFDDGRVASLGAGALKEPGLVCVRGTRATPWSNCEAALLDPTSLERQLGPASCGSPK